MDLLYNITQLLGFENDSGSNASATGAEPAEEARATLGENENAAGGQESKVIRLNDILNKVSTYRPGTSNELIKKAYVFSAKVHQGKATQDDQPYLTHPMELGAILADLKMDEATICTGLLHDTIEENLSDLATVKDIFGQEVASLVDGVTKLSKYTLPETKEETHAENFRKMLLAMAEDVRVIIVRLADRLHVMRTLDSVLPAEQERIASETIEIYAPLANRLGISWIKSELEDRSFRYLKPHEYYSLVEKIDRKRKEREQYTKEVVKIVSDKMRSQNILCDVAGRPKHIYSIHRKMRREHLDLDQVYDIIAFRIITDTVPQCYAVLGIIHNIWKPIPGRFKDYIATPKPNMYRSLHTTVIGPYNERVEFQIRTKEMHNVAEEGIAAHWLYKEDKDFSAKDEKRFIWLHNLLEWQRDLKDPAEFLEFAKIDLFSEEVFVFTPRGDVKSLPKGSTPLDFAYSVHTEVGHHCAGAKVSGKIVPLRYKLKNGDVVEILTSPNARPAKDWLAIAKSTRARSKIRAYLNLQERERAIEIGKEICDKEFKKYELNFPKMLRNGELQPVAEALKYVNADDLVAAVGYNSLQIEQVLKRLLPEERLSRQVEQKEGVLDKLLKRVSSSKSGVVIDGITDMLIRFGRCCAPVPGEEIAGFITRGRGVTVHAANCKRIFEIEKARRIDVKWETASQIQHGVGVKVITADKTGMLAAISGALSKAGINITYASCDTGDDGKGVCLFNVLISDRKQLKSALDEIEGIDGVYSVSRTAPRISVKEKK